MNKRYELARDQGLNWQALLITDAETDLKEIVRNAVVTGEPWERTNKRVIALVSQAVDELESEELKAKTRSILYAYATKQYEKMRNSGINWGILQVIQDIEKADAMPDTEIIEQIIQDSGYVPQRAAALDEFVKTYMNRVKQVYRELALSEAKDGYSSNVSLRNIAEMTVRYEKNMAMLKDQRDSGVRLVWISTHANCSKRCQDAQGKLYSLDGTSGTEDGIPYVPLSVATDKYYVTKAGKVYKNGTITGYNCRHRTIPYTKGSKPIEIPAEVVERERKINDTQRDYERRIRQLESLAIVYKNDFPKDSRFFKKQAKKLTDQYRKYSERNKVPFFYSRLSAEETF